MVSVKNHVQSMILRYFWGYISIHVRMLSFDPVGFHVGSHLPVQHPKATWGPSTRIQAAAPANGSVPQKTGSLGWCLLLFFWAGDDGCQNFQMVEVGVWNSMESYGVQFLTRNHGFDHQVLNPGIGDYCGKTCHIFLLHPSFRFSAREYWGGAPVLLVYDPPRTIARYTHRYY